MFDTAKVQRMLPEFAQFVQTHPEIYLLVQGGNIQNLFALLRRMKIAPRALIINSPTPIPPQSFLGVPMKGFDECVRNFNPKTGVVILDKKSPPISLTNITIGIVGGQPINIPAFVMNDDECMAIYDRLTMMRVLQQYAEDGIGYVPPKNLMKKFARGLTTFLDPNFQNVKVQFIDMRTHVMPKFDFDDVGIVIQGPLVYEHNYTIQTARQYRSLYPKVPIVISTWKGEATEQFRSECKKHSIVLLENTLPPESGYLNVNYQIESSFRGMNYLSENTSVRFAIKTRSDQRVNRPDFLLYFKNMLKTFPAFGNRLKSRIITLAQIGFLKWLPFFICDCMTFGIIDDISNFYDLPPQTDEPHLPILRRDRLRNVRKMLGAKEYVLDVPTKPSWKLRNFNLMMNQEQSIPEIYIARSFYQKYIAPINPEKLLETYWKFLHDYILPINISDLQFDWFKYEHVRYGIDKLDFDHARWLNLYNNFDIDWV